MSNFNLISLKEAYKRIPEINYKVALKHDEDINNTIGNYKFF